MRQLVGLGQLDCTRRCRLGHLHRQPTRLDDGGASHIPFIVRNDASTSQVLFKTSDTTWQSYNAYGNVNLYGYTGTTHAHKVSYNRPFQTRGTEPENYLFNAEYPMLRWLERNGYDVSYTTMVDLERARTTDQPGPRSAALDRARRVLVPGTARCGGVST